ncbi:hypothetical protein DRN97_06545 [Methanosarcinales archaeon]|nr:MAG: hypothetical protein DRN97_06545 [Methanosarcinales archaeon]
MKIYANIADLSEIPEPILNLAIRDWFDREDTIIGQRRIDDMWVRIVGDDEIVRARAEVLKRITKVRHGGGVRIKEVEE